VDECKPLFYGALLFRFMPPADAGACEKDPAPEVLALRKLRVTCLAGAYTRPLFSST